MTVSNRRSTTAPSSAAEGAEVPANQGVLGSELPVDPPEPEPIKWREDPWNAFKQKWKRGMKIDRKQLAALGASAVCSYGFVSNINYCGTMCAAYVIHAQKNGLSPFAPGQWKGFLAIYGGLWAAMNFLRPVRIWMSLGLTPYFDKLVDAIKRKAGVNKSVAFGITVFLVNVCGTLTFLSTGLYLSSLYTRVPLFPGRVPAPT